MRYKTIREYVHPIPISVLGLREGLALLLSVFAHLFLLMIIMDHPMRVDHVTIPLEIKLVTLVSSVSEMPRSGGKPMMISNKPKEMPKTAPPARPTVLEKPPQESDSSLFTAGALPVDNIANTTESPKSGSQGGSGTTDGQAGGGSVPTLFIPLVKVTKMPIFKTRVAPVYPPLAKQLEKEGTVIVDISISETGSILKAKIVQELGFGFDEAVLEAMRQSSFEPAQVGDMPVAVVVRIPITFRFKD
jgi:protein TonB